MTGHFLVLYPKNPVWVPGSLVALAGALKSVGLVGEERSPGLYSAGPEYLGLITYIGCSPQVALGDNEAATTIRINDIFDTQQFLHGANLKSPRCPHCRKSLEKPPAVQSANALLQCPHCGHAGRLSHSTGVAARPAHACLLRSRTWSNPRRCPERRSPIACNRRPARLGITAM